MWYKFAQNENNSEDLALKNNGKANQPFAWLKPTDENGILIIEVSNDSIDKLKKINKNLDKPLRINYTFYFDDNESDHQIVGDVNFENIPKDLDQNILDEIKRFVIEKVKIIFPTNDKGLIISPYKVFSDLNLKVFLPDQAVNEEKSLDFKNNFDPSKLTNLSVTQGQFNVPARAGTGIGMSVSVLEPNISLFLPEQKLDRKPMLPETKIVTDNTNDLVSTKPVKYPKYNFPINVESLAKSTYRFKAPVEIYIDGVLKSKGHPNQSMYPLYSEYEPLSEGTHTLQAKDPNFDTTNTKIMNTQTFTFEVKENQPIRIIKEEPRPGSF